MKAVKVYGILFFLLTLWGVQAANAAVLKIATLSPEGSSWMNEMRAGAEEVAQKTKNGVRIKFYPGGVMGDDKAVLRKIRLRQLQGGAVVSGSLSEIFPDNQIYNLPIIFKSFEEVDYVREKMDPIIIKGLADKGFVVLGMAGGGFAYVMSQKPVSTISDLKHQKVWVPDNDRSSLAILTSFGVKPIPLSIADVRAGLQTGLIDTIVTSPVAAIALQWHSQVKYLTEAPIMYIYGMLAVEKEAFSKLSKEHQTVIEDVMGRLFEKIEQQNREDNGKALAAMRAQGVQVVSPPDSTMAEWRQEALKVVSILIQEGRLSQAIVDTFNGHISDFRNGQSK
jgi:TRAP-type C4-dicarboxylate transport system substrate-binding protein